MDNLYLGKTESIILSSSRISLDSVVYDVMLTTERLILTDDRDTLFQPRCISLEDITTLRGGTASSGDPVITLILSTSDEAQGPLHLVFVQQSGEKRKEERDTWVKHIMKLRVTLIQKATHVEPTPVITQQGIRPLVRHWIAPEKVRPLTKAGSPPEDQIPLVIISEEPGIPEPVSAGVEEAHTDVEIHSDPAKGQEPDHPETLAIWDEHPGEKSPADLSQIPLVSGEQELPCSGTEMISPEPDSFLQSSRASEAGISYSTGDEVPVSENDLASELSSAVKDSEDYGQSVNQSSGTEPASSAPGLLPDEETAYRTAGTEPPLSEEECPSAPEASVEISGGPSESPEQPGGDETVVAGIPSEQNEVRPPAESQGQLTVITPELSSSDSYVTAERIDSHAAFSEQHDDQGISIDALPGVTPSVPERSPANESLENTIRTALDSLLLSEVLPGTPSNSSEPANGEDRFRECSELPFAQSPAPLEESEGPMTGIPMDAPLMQPETVIDSQREGFSDTATIYPVSREQDTVQESTREEPALRPPLLRIPLFRLPDRKNAILSGTAVIFILLLAAGALFASTSLHKETFQHPLPSVNTTPAVTPEPTPSPLLVPQQGLWVRINASGSYRGLVGNPDLLRSVTGSGDQVYKLVNSEGIVQVSVGKQDDSGNPLSVEIYKDGTLIISRTVTSPRGSIDLLIDPRTGLPPGLTVTPTPANNLSGSSGRLEYY